MTARPSDPPLRRIGRFELLRELGRGGMGAVYAARDPQLDRVVALKLILAPLDGESWERFEREAQLLARVRHPGVLPLYELGRAPEGPYLVTELIEGEPLDARVARGPLAPRAAAELMCSVASALEAVHRAGILHRDLKPDNVLIRADGSPVLLDFGVARELNAGGLTQTGAVIGTPAYMAPEQALGLSPRLLDARVDVHGLGALLFALLCGRAPYQGASTLEVLQRVAEAPPTWPPEAEALPAELRAICLDCLAKDPAARPPGAAALGARLETWLRASASHAAGVPGRKRTLAVLAVLAALSMGLAVLAIRSRSAAREPGPPAKAPPPARLVVPKSAAGARLRATPLDAAGAPLEGELPREFVLSPGRWRLRVDSPRDLPQVREVELASGETRRCRALLRPRQRWYLNLSEPHSLTIEDVDGDGLAEILVAKGRELVCVQGIGASRWYDSREAPLRALLPCPRGQERIALGITREGRLCAYDPDGRQLWSFDLQGETSPPRLVAWARGREADVACYGPRGLALFDPATGRKWDRARARGPLAVPLRIGPERSILAVHGDVGVHLAGSSGEDVGFLGAWSDGVALAGAVAADLAGTGTQTLVLLLGDGSLEALTRREHRGWQRTGDALEVQAVELDGKPGDELLVREGDQLLCLPPRGAEAALWRLPGVVSRMTIAQVDGEGPPELLLNARGELRCVGADGALRWALPATDAAPVVAELDPRPGLEVAFASAPDEVRCVGAGGEERWRHALQTPVRELAAGDLDGDRAPELVVATAGQLYCLTGNTSPLSWAIPTNIDFQQAARLGPWAVFHTPTQCLAASAGGALHLAQVPGWGLPVWEPGGARVIIPRGQVFAWRPGEKPAPWVEGPGACAAAPVGSTLVVGRNDGRLELYPLPDPGPKPRTVAELSLGLIQPPCPLDLDGDGEDEAFLALPRAPEAVLVDLAGRVLARHELPAPVAFAPARLGGSPPRLVLATADGSLLGLEVQPDGLRVFARRALDDTPALAPVLVPFASGAQLVLATRRGWLLAFAPSLDEVLWADLEPSKSFLPGIATGSITWADLDHDGSLELLSSWRLRSAPSSVLRIHDAQGRRRGQLPISPDGTAALAPVAPGKPLPLLTGGRTVRAWTHWSQLAPPAPVSLRRLERLAAGGAWSRVAAEAPLLAAPERADPLLALGEYLAGRTAAWERLLRADRAAARQVARRLRRLNESLALERRLQAAVEIASKPVQPPTFRRLNLRQAPPAEPPSIRLLSEPGLRSGELDLFSDRPLRLKPGWGTRVPPGARLRVRFVLVPGEQPRWLALRHGAQPAHALPVALLRLRLNDQPLSCLLASPLASGADAPRDRIPLPALEPGTHRLELEVDSGSSAELYLQAVELLP